jgi:hypothetical protein
MTTKQFKTAKINGYTVADVNKEMWKIACIDYSRESVYLEPKQITGNAIVLPVSMVSEFKILTEKDYRVFEKDYYTKTE